MRIDQWSQLNNGDIQGVLNETRNCNFNKAGVITLANKAGVFKNDVVADGGSAFFEQVMGLESYADDIYAITDGSVYKGDLDGTALADTTAGDIPRGTSSVVCYGLLYAVSDTEDVDTYNGSSWTADAITGLNAGSVSNVGFPMAVFDSLTTYKLAIGGTDSSGNAIVRVYNSSNSNAGATNLTLPENFIITSLAYRNGYLFVGTKTDSGSEAKVFVWDGNTASANFSVPVGASFVYALVPYKSSVAGVTNEGEVFVISGSQKVPLAGFPIYHAKNTRWTKSADEVGNIVHKGMAVAGDRIYISIEANLASGAFLPEMKDGLWVFDPVVGLYHYASPTTDPVVRDSGLSRSTNELTTSANHNLKTGDAVSFASIGSLTGVTTDTVYYAIVTGDATLELAGNRYDADQGNAITLGGTPDSNDDLVYVENTDNGTLLDSTAGAVLNTNHRTDATASLESDVVFGAEPYNLSDAVESTVQCFCDSWNVGWFATQKIYSPNIKDTWHKLHVFLNGVLLSNESVIVKARTKERAGMPTRDVAITWSDADTFTTTDHNAANNLQAGDEVVFLRGRGQGQTAHITSVSVAAGTTTVNIDESYGVASDTGKAYFTNYKKINEIDYTREDEGILTFVLDKSSSWVQIKVEMRGFNIEVAGLELTNPPKKIAT